MGPETVALHNTAAADMYGRSAAKSAEIMHMKLNLEPPLTPLPETNCSVY